MGRTSMRKSKLKKWLKIEKHLKEKRKKQSQKPRPEVGAE
jgi:hypothetical protein